MQDTAIYNNTCARHSDIQQHVCKTQRYTTTRVQDTAINNNTCARHSDIQQHVCKTQRYTTTRVQNTAIYNKPSFKTNLLKPDSNICVKIDSKYYRLQHGRQHSKHGIAPCSNGAVSYFTDGSSFPYVGLGHALFPLTNKVITQHCCRPATSSSNTRYPSRSSQNPCSKINYITHINIIIVCCFVWV